MENKLNNCNDMTSESGGSEADAPYDTCHAKKGSLTFGAMSKQKAIEKQ